MEAAAHSRVDPERRAAAHDEHVGVVGELRGRIEALEEREPELRKQIKEIERVIRTKPENVEELQEQVAELRGELKTIPGALIDVRCRLGMKMSDFALDEDDGHEDAITYLKPLLDELRGAYNRALFDADRDVADAEEKMKALHAEHHDHGGEAVALVEQRFQPLVDAEMVGVNVEQANVRVARHKLALVDQEDTEQRLARELDLEDALAELAAARARVSALQEQKRATAARYAHPHVAKSKAKGKKLVKRFGHLHR